ncbi:MAG TPA: GYF domain-containing protein [Anaeromyxobacteraceae bacterium]|nr:GYF domain-containing protein [Anaeromyxobacteraceae bacterium]
MKFSCDRCDAQYMISDEKVGPNGVKVRCKKCSHVILVRRPAQNEAAAPEKPAPQAAPAPGGAGEGLDAELGQAFDNAFGGPAKTAAPPPDLDATQAVSPEEASRLVAAQTPEPAATEWYVAIGQAQVGPLPLLEVRRKWEMGDIGPDSLVWRPGMGDWAPLTGVSDLSAYLAPVARAAARARLEPASAPAGGKAGAAPTASATEPARADVSWKPVGANALAALASEEMAGRPSEPRPEAKPVVSAKSIVDGLPEGGGVDPTGAIPLQIKALETTGETPAQKSSVARGAERIRKKRSSTRALVTGLSFVAILGVAAAAYFGYGAHLLPKGLSPASAPAVAEKPATLPEASAPTPEKPTAEPAPNTEAAGGPAPAAVPPGPAATPPATAEAASPATAPPPPSAAPAEKHKAKEPARPAAHEPSRTAHSEKKAREAPPPKAEHTVARAEAPPPPAAAPTTAVKKKGNDLLDFEPNDPALEEALGGKGGGGRSVYVPPAASADELPERVSDSQVNETIMTRVTALQGCLADNKSGGSGVLKMKWSIAPDGSVRDLKCVSPENANTPFAACVTDVLKGLRFPKTAQGRPDVTFPFKF